VGWGGEEEGDGMVEVVEADERRRNGREGRR
jgi:hypothetical protein